MDADPSQSSSRRFYSSTNEHDFPIDFDEGSTPSFRDLTRLFFALIRDHRFTFVLALGHLVVATLGYVVLAVAVGTLVDSTLYSLDFDVTLSGARIPGSLDQIAAFLFFTMILVVYCSFFEMAAFVELGERAAARLRVEVFRHLVLLPMAFYNRNRTGELTSRILADVSVLQETWANDLRMAIKNSLLFFGMIGMMFLVSPILALKVSILIPPVVLVSLWFGKIIRKTSTDVQERLSESTVVVEETLRGINIVKTFGNEMHETNRFWKHLENFLGPAVKAARQRAGFVSAIMFVLLSAMVFLIWQGSREIAAQRMSPGEFTSFMSFLFTAGTAGTTLSYLVGKFQRMTGAASRVLDIAANDTEEIDSGSYLPDSRERLKGHVEFRDVSFSYPSRPEIEVLSGINLELVPGERVAMVGPSGSGKTTIAALLFRLFETDEGGGEILIDGRPISEFPLNWVRRQMAIVPQEVVLFGGTVAENIAYGKPGASRVEVETAARQANATEFIMKLPQGLDTRIGDHGVHLSGGQRQRIAIARAILKDPAILVMDEATSSLDNESERLVREAMHELMKSRTTFIIAHRLSTIREADRILVMRDGRIVENGSHLELYYKGNYYRLLCDAEKAAEEQEERHRGEGDRRTGTDRRQQPGEVPAEIGKDRRSGPRENAEQEPQEKPTQEV